MGADKIAKQLKAYAASTPDAIVEVGAWLGAGTVSLVKGSRGENPVHVFDQWRANASEVEKLQRFGVSATIGQDLLPIFLANVGASNVVCHKGLIQHAEWNGPHIGLYVDDASKSAPDWNHVMDIFCPWFIPGSTHLFLMDFYFRLAHAQREWMKQNRHRFEHVSDLRASVHSDTALFRFIGP